MRFDSLLHLRRNPAFAVCWVLRHFRVLPRVRRDGSDRRSQCLDLMHLRKLRRLPILPRRRADRPRSQGVAQLDPQTAASEHSTHTRDGPLMADLGHTWCDRLNFRSRPTMVDRELLGFAVNNCFPRFCSNATSINHKIWTANT
jgi:hypothetical protein